MFEQPLYEFGRVEKPVEDSDLFRDYELKSWIFTPRIVRIIALSAVVNVVAILVVGQTSLLTLKGCDSPLVGSVCQVLDTVYVGALLFGTDREYIDAAYENTKLDADDEITYIDVSHVLPPIKYPEGYFQVANPEQFVVPEEILDGQNFTQDIPGIPNGIPMAQGNSLFDTPQKLPTANPNILDGDLSGGGNAYNNGGGGVYFPPIRSNRPRRQKNPKPVPTPDDSFTGTPDEDLVAENESPSPTPSPSPTVEPAPAANKVEVNARVWTDFADIINDRLDKKQVNLDTPFLMSALGKLTPDGKLDPKSFSVTRAESADPKMLEVIKEVIEATNNSGFLQYLQMFDATNLAFTLQQDDKTVTAMVESLFKDEQRPKTMSQLFTAFVGGKIKEKEKPDASQNDRDELFLLQNAAATPNGKKMVVTFSIPKADFQRLIQRRLAEHKAKPKPTDGNATTKPTANAAKN